MSDSTLHDAASYYAELGYQVFPCLPGQKRPATQHGFKDASTDPAQIDKWWSENHDYNVAIATGGYLVLDVDGLNNHWPNDGDKAISLCGCPLATTPRGGSHRWFRGGGFASKVGIAPAVDIRADGGYVVVPPSRIVGDRKSVV